MGEMCWGMKKWGMNGGVLEICSRIIMCMSMVVVKGEGGVWVMVC